MACAVMLALGSTAHALERGAPASSLKPAPAPAKGAPPSPPAGQGNAKTDPPSGASLPAKVATQALRLVGAPDKYAPPELPATVVTAKLRLAGAPDKYAPPELPATVVTAKLRLVGPDIAAPSIIQTAPLILRGVQ
jgi:hypothetical protein